MTARPFVYANMAMTADGKITSARREHPQLTSPFDRRMMDRLRAEADAIIVGAGTVRADDPPLGVRDSQMQSYQASLGRSASPIEIVVSRSLCLDENASFFAGDARRIVATVEDAPEERVARLCEHATVWRVGQTQVDIAALLERLASEGVQRLLLEGGAELNWSFLAADCLDELYLTLAPTLLGGAQAPSPIAGHGLTMDSQRRLELLSTHREADELYLRYRVTR